jgi:hypothetical protein
VLLDPTLESAPERRLLEDIETLWLETAKRHQKNSRWDCVGPLNGPTRRDRKRVHRLAQLALAVTFILTAKLIDWRNRWTPDLAPIR